MLKVVLLPKDLSFIGEKVKVLRELMELTLSEFANKAQTNYRMVSHYEKGERGIKSDFVVKLIFNLKVNPYWLFWDDSKTARENIETIRVYISSLEKEAGKSIFISDKFDLPDNNGELNIFLSGANMSLRDKIENYIYDSDDLKIKAIDIIARLEKASPILVSIYDDINELKKILSKL